MAHRIPPLDLTGYKKWYEEEDEKADNDHSQRGNEVRLGHPGLSGQGQSVDEDAGQTLRPEKR